MSDFATKRAARLICGHILVELPKLPKASIHCIVTSPPYWGLRDYRIDPQVWGDEAGCAHEWGEDERPHHPGQVEQTKWKAAVAAGAGGVASGGAFCSLCGAWRGSLGLEPTIDLYLTHLVDIFEECRRVLRDDGTLWLNIGDSYAGSWGSQGHRETPPTFKRNSIKNHPKKASRTGVIRDAGLKPKDMCLIPFRLAIALQEAGWWVRSDIVWAKPAPMPESVTDRPTRAHEYVFLLTKSARYFYDAAAVREADKGSDHPRAILSGQPSLEPSGGIASPHRGLRTVNGRDGLGRNLRSVWTLAPAPFPGAHFATFPPALAERCIRAGSPAGGVVLDPFGGAGTTAMVALRLGRAAISIDLSSEYTAMAERRIREDAPLLNQVESPPFDEARP